MFNANYANDADTTICEMWYVRGIVCVKCDVLEVTDHARDTSEIMSVCEILSQLDLYVKHQICKI